jgi:hypothetical protein
VGVLKVEKEMEEDCFGKGVSPKPPREYCRTVAEAEAMKAAVVGFAVMKVSC